MPLPIHASHRNPSTGPPPHGTAARATEKDNLRAVGRPAERRATTTTRDWRAVDRDPCARASEGRAREGRCETGGRHASASKKNRAFARVDEGVGVSENAHPGVKDRSDRDRERRD